MGRRRVIRALQYSSFPNKLNEFFDLVVETARRNEQAGNGHLFFSSTWSVIYIHSGMDYNDRSLVAPIHKVILDLGIELKKNIMKER